MRINESELFCGISPAVMDMISQIMIKETGEKGIFLFHTGDPAKYFYILQDGRISICADKKDHAVSFVHIPGELFGWSCLVDRNAYSASAEYVVHSTVLKIEKEKLVSLLQKNPADGCVFYKNFATIIGRRFLDTCNVKDWFPSIAS